MEPAPWDPADAPDKDFVADHALAAARDAEILPGDDPTPLSIIEGELRHVPDFRKIHHWVVRDAGGRIVGASSLEWEDTPYNRHLAMIDVRVLPEHRGRGVARHLLVPVAAVAAQLGRHTLVADEVADIGPAPGFLAAAGFAKGAAERRSRLRVGDLDAPMLRDWTKGTAGYELLTWVGPTPDDLIDDFAALKAAQADAPWGDIEFEPERYDTAHVADQERRKVQAGCEVWTAAVRPTAARSTAARSTAAGPAAARPTPAGPAAGASAGLAGFTQLFLWPERPTLAWQAWTAVDPAHRGRGLARWVKAANALRLVDERPAVTHVDTVNEVTNAPMLAVNVMMGFRPLLEIGSWTAEADAVAAYAAKRA